MKKQKIKSTAKNSSCFFKNNDYCWNHSFNERIHYYHQVTKKVIDFIQTHEIKSVCLFLSCLDQINTLGIMQWCFDHQIDVFVYNFDATSNNFDVCPVENFDYETTEVKSFKNILTNKTKLVKTKKMDLIIAPVYFLNPQNKIAYYFEMKNYSRVAQISHKRIIGIGYENLMTDNKLSKFLKKRNKTYKLHCNEIFLARESN